MDNMGELQNAISTILGRLASLNKNPPVSQNQSSPGSSRNVPNQQISNTEKSKSKRNRRPPKLKKDMLLNDKMKIKKKKGTANSANSVPSHSKSTQLNRHIKNNPPKNVNDDDMLKVEMSFREINTVNGTYIRTRSKNSKYIRLRTFIKNKQPIIFKTDFSLFKLAEMLTNLYIQNSENSQSNKKKKVKNGRARQKCDQIKKEPDTAIFPQYISKEEMESGLVNGSLIQGAVRINPKNFKDAYVSNEDSSIADYYLTSVADRNRALDGDEVILKLKPKTEWINGQRTATVVYLKDKIHPRIITGSLKPSEKKNATYALFYPRDKRFPILRIADNDLPAGFKKKPNLFENALFVAKILNWEVPTYANGILLEKLGKAGDLVVETLSILREHCLDTTPFPEEMKSQHLFMPSEIPEIEFKYREDLRSQCIFTIDPQTARDLDDAVSLKRLPNGNYEVGVHISDVSYYLKEGNELDQMVSKKATTIYLVDVVFHMLPEELCMHCSLLPGKDKLAFSVFWEMTHDGEILHKTVCRSVINSCAKLSYNHAQSILDGNVSNEEFPAIYNNYSISDLTDTLNVLQTIAVKLRQKRFDNGALKIDQIKLWFTIDPSTGEPMDFRTYENLAAHRLIEEFMLLANITVAEYIRDAFPNIAFLRCHEPPKYTMLVDLKNCLESYGIHIDISSSSTIRSSIQKYETNDYAGRCRSVVLNHLIAKTMTRAKYFCSSLMESDVDFKHYALSVPIYTHFTSPIRRYVDIMVHRLLAASLGYIDPPEWDALYVRDIAINCNYQKYNAKRAGEASSELYLAHYIQTHKPYIQNCVVVDVKDRSFDAIVINTGSLIRIYSNNCEEGTIWKVSVIPSINLNKGKGSPAPEHEKRQLKLKITFPKTQLSGSTTIDLEIFTIVQISLEKKNNSYKLEGTLLRPFHEKKQ